MKPNYTPIPHEFLEEMAELSDAEYGRLIRWGQEYMIRGTTTQLSGNERFYAKRLQTLIDRFCDAPALQKRSEGKPGDGKRQSTGEPDLSSFGEDLQSSIREWLQYKLERKETYTQIGMKKLLTRIRNYADRYGEQAMVALIAECEASNYKGIIFDKLDRSRKSAGGSKDRRVANYDYTETEDCL